MDKVRDVARCGPIWAMLIKRRRHPTGKYRRLMRQEFDSERCGRRWQVETVFLMIDQTQSGQRPARPELLVTMPGIDASGDHTQSKKLCDRGFSIPGTPPCARELRSRCASDRFLQTRLPCIRRTQKGSRIRLADYADDPLRRRRPERFRQKNAMPHRAKVAGSGAVAEPRLKNWPSCGK